MWCVGTARLKPCPDTNRSLPQACIIFMRKQRERGVGVRKVECLKLLSRAPALRYSLNWAAIPAAILAFIINGFAAMAQTAPPASPLAFAQAAPSSPTQTLPSAATQAAASSSTQLARSPAHFVDLASKAGIAVPVTFGGKVTKRYIIETTGSGVAIFDYDNDGWPDIFIVK